MGDYISRDMAIARLTKVEVTEKLDTMTEAKRAIAEMPAADVAPVRHGMWDSLDGYKTRRVCSVCGWDVPEYGKFYSYCPNCGAKMDGGADDETD